MINDADIMAAEMHEAASWYECTSCHDETHVTKLPADERGRCPRCAAAPDYSMSCPPGTPGKEILLALLTGSSAGNRNPYSGIRMLARRLEVTADMGPRYLDYERRDIAAGWQKAHHENATPWADVGECSDGGIASRGCVHSTDDPKARYFVRFHPDQENPTGIELGYIHVTDAQTGSTIHASRVADILDYVATLRLPEERYHQDGAKPAKLAAAAIGTPAKPAPPPEQQLALI